MSLPVLSNEPAVRRTFRRRTHSASSCPPARRAPASAAAARHLSQGRQRP